MHANFKLDLPQQRYESYERLVVWEQRTDPHSLPSRVASQLLPWMCLKEKTTTVINSNYLKWQYEEEREIMKFNCTEQTERNKKSHISKVAVIEGSQNKLNKAPPQHTYINVNVQREYSESKLKKLSGHKSHAISKIFVLRGRYMINFLFSLQLLWMNKEYL